MSNEQITLDVASGEVMAAPSAPWWRRGIDLPSLLRVVGAAVVVAAISALLFQDWERGDDLQRYLMLLAHTVMLGVTGFAIGHFLNETKGARTFVMLAVASIPVNFAILGALGYSHFGGGAVHDLPALATWNAAGHSMTLLITLVAPVALGTVALIGFLVLARRSAPRLTLLYLTLNAMLLLPTRDPGLIGALFFGAVALAGWQVRRLTNADVGLRTAEGFMARLVQFAPAAILLGRNLWLYSADAFLYGASALGLYTLVRLAALGLAPLWRRRLETLSLVPAMAAAWGLAATVSQLANPLFLPVAAVLFAAMAVELSLHAVAGHARYRRMAAFALGGGLMLNLLLHGGGLNGLLCLASGVGVFAYGYGVRQRSVLVLGTITALVGLVEQSSRLAVMVDFAAWEALAGIGVTTIMVASLMERYGARLKARLSEWNSMTQGWEN